MLWRVKFLHLDPKTNSGRSEALLKLSGKKLLHLRMTHFSMSALLIHTVFAFLSSRYCASSSATF